MKKRYWSWVHLSFLGYILTSVTYAEHIVRLDSVEGVVELFTDEGEWHALQSGDAVFEEKFVRFQPSSRITMRFSRDNYDQKVMLSFYSVTLIRLNYDLYKTLGSRGHYFTQHERMTSRGFKDPAFMRSFENAWNKISFLFMYGEKEENEEADKEEEKKSKGQGDSALRLSSKEKYPSVFISTPRDGATFVIDRMPYQLPIAWTTEGESAKKKVRVRLWRIGEKSRNDLVFDASQGYAWVKVTTPGQYYVQIESAKEGEKLSQAHLFVITGMP